MCWAAPAPRPHRLRRCQCFSCVEYRIVIARVTFHCFSSGQQATPAWRQPGSCFTRSPLFVTKGDIQGRCRVNNAGTLLRAFAPVCKPGPLGHVPRSVSTSCQHILGHNAPLIQSPARNLRPPPRRQSSRIQLGWGSGTCDHFIVLDAVTRDLC